MELTPARKLLFSDQTERFANKDWKDVAFTEASVGAGMNINSIVYRWP